MLVHTMEEIITFDLTVYVNEAQARVCSCFLTIHLHLVLIKLSLEALLHHDPTGRSKGVTNIVLEEPPAFIPHLSLHGVGLARWFVSIRLPPRLEDNPFRHKPVSGLLLQHPNFKTGIESRCPVGGTPATFVGGVPMVTLHYSFHSAPRNPSIR